MLTAALIRCNTRSSSAALLRYLAAASSSSILPSRSSTSGAVKRYQQVQIKDEKAAEALANHLHLRERALLLEVLQRKADEEATDNKEPGETIKYRDARQLFIVNTLPFVGFGILDNMIMILAGEYIDQTLGAWLAISTMCAAACGNIISDIAGIGLAHYVEVFVQRLGIRHPPLTSAQLESPRARYIVNGARAFGLVVGCIIGMTPLAFF